MSGAEPGIGRAIADRLSRDRAHLAVNHRTSVEDAAALVESMGQPPASRSIRAAMMKSLRESPPTEWVESRTTSRPHLTSSSG